MSECLENQYAMQIPDMTFFCGSAAVIAFAFYDGQENPIDLNNVIVYWRCAPYGRPDFPVLKYSTNDGYGKITIDTYKKNICYVNLDSNDTANLKGLKYVQQPIIEFNGKKYIRAEGNIIFKPSISES